MIVMLMGTPDASPGYNRREFLGSVSSAAALHIASLTDNVSSAADARVLSPSRHTPLVEKGSARYPASVDAWKQERGVAHILGRIEAMVTSLQSKGRYQLSSGRRGCAVLDATELLHSVGMHHYPLPPEIVDALLTLQGREWDLDQRRCIDGIYRRLGALMANHPTTHPSFRGSAWEYCESANTHLDTTIVPSTKDVQSLLQDTPVGLSAGPVTQSLARIGNATGIVAGFTPHNLHRWTMRVGRREEKMLPHPSLLITQSTVSQSDEAMQYHITCGMDPLVGSIAYMQSVSAYSQFDGKVYVSGAWPSHARFTTAEGNSTSLPHALRLYGVVARHPCTGAVDIDDGACTVGYQALSFHKTPMPDGTCTISVKIVLGPDQCAHKVLNAQGDIHIPYQYRRAVASNRYQFFQGKKRVDHVQKPACTLPRPARQMQQECLCRGTPDRVEVLTYGDAQWESIDIPFEPRE